MAMDKLLPICKNLGNTVLRESFLKNLMSTSENQIDYRYSFRTTGDCQTYS